MLGLLFAWAEMPVAIPPDQIKLAQDPTWEDIKTATSAPMSAGRTTTFDGLLTPRSEFSSASSSGQSGSGLADAADATEPASSPRADDGVVRSKAKQKKGKKAPPRLMRASVKHVQRADTTAKRGQLMLMESHEVQGEGDSGTTGGAEWRNVWAVLRRPYLTLYTSSSEQEELDNVINVSTVRVDHSSALEEVTNVSCAPLVASIRLGLLKALTVTPRSGSCFHSQRKFTFGIYTPVSALFVAAPTYPDMLNWLGLIDPTWQRQAE